MLSSLDFEFPLLTSLFTASTFNLEPYSYLSRILLLDISLFSSMSLSTLTLDSHDSGVSLRIAEIMSGEDPMTMHPPHSEVVSGTVFRMNEKCYIRIHWITKVPRTMTRKYMLWKIDSKTLKSLLPIFLQLISLNSCIITKLLKIRVMCLLLASPAGPEVFVVSVI